MTSIESPLTGGGIPDCEICFPGGLVSWIEFKTTASNAVRLRPLQVSWHEHRARVGGRSFIAVRRIRVTKQIDELHLFDGAHARVVAQFGLQAQAVGVWSGGPAKWPWREIEKALNL